MFLTITYVVMISQLDGDKSHTPAMKPHQVYTVGPSGTSLLMWAVTGNHGSEWTYADVILSNTAPFRVTFQAEVGGDMWTDIALDDISYTEECAVGGEDDDDDSHFLSFMCCGQFSGPRPPVFTVFGLLFSFCPPSSSSVSITTLLQSNEADCPSE